MATGEASLGSQYVLLDEIGAGAMGAVWRARHRETGELVAVKLLRDGLTGDQELVMRFVQERNVMRSLRHPNIVTVRDFVIEGDRLAMVMDLVEGGSLQALLRRHGTLPPAEAARMMAEVADALAAAHAAGVVHRDVKPANILIEQATGRVRLTDFGVARIVYGPGLTQSTAIIGTPMYLAPETAMGEKPTPAVDVYAIGLILYQLLAGRPPFIGDHPVALIKQHSSAAPRRLPGMPDALWSLIARCAAKNPADRPTAAQVAAELRRAMPALAGLPPLPPVPWDADPSITSEPLPASAAGPAPAVQRPGGAPGTGRPGGMPGAAGMPVPPGTADTAPGGTGGTLPKGGKQAAGVPVPGFIGVPGAGGGTGAGSAGAPATGSGGAAGTGPAGVLATGSGGVPQVGSTGVPGLPGAASRWSAKKRWLLAGTSTAAAGAVVLSVVFFAPWRSDGEAHTRALGSASPGALATAMDSASAYPDDGDRDPVPTPAWEDQARRSPSPKATTARPSPSLTEVPRPVVPPPTTQPRQTTAPRPQQSKTAQPRKTRVVQPEPKATTVKADEPPPSLNWQCRSWFDTGQGVQMSPCMAMVGDTFYLLGRVQGSSAAKWDILVGLFDSDNDVFVSKTFTCLNGTAPYECGPFTVKVPRKGVKTDVRQRWRKSGTPSFGGGVESPWILW
ncbi:serine/threonine-protein kinase [Thermobispora bispora]|uniref:non-specific serine/threonine protein kinase n=1 Tax=Thermobispora bispora (strain ATCC 19993 / DSM 43833 / CBS 139.67 / JCM 10125 / KCTC 9307 / NBRC 14880 / R51) TaxID=469371 RepID=D6Y298_THEBD|nr:serine/threonine-protein kinase [Thermobispora bispora]ADG86833.1 serine/threonine protein kinase [Thermobispora bispora DSM 43833]MDI9580793.1 protein kinase [Thermobispora sp.]